MIRCLIDFSKKYLLKSLYKLELEASTDRELITKKEMTVSEHEGKQ